MVTIASKFSTMVGEILKHQFPQVVRIEPKLSTMNGKMFKY